VMSTRGVHPSRSLRARFFSLTCGAEHVRQWELSPSGLDILRLYDPAGCTRSHPRHAFAAGASFGFWYTLRFHAAEHGRQRRPLR
jgi:hypothetical protein